MKSYKKKQKVVYGIESEVNMMQDIFVLSILKLPAHLRMVLPCVQRAKPAFQGVSLFCDHWLLILKLKEQKTRWNKGR